MKKMWVHIFGWVHLKCISSVAQSCQTLRPHGLQHARAPCPSSVPGVYSNSCPLSQMLSNHLILCCLLFLPPSIFPSIRVFSNESVLRIRWPKYWSFSFNISPSKEYSGLISFRMDCLYLLAVQGTHIHWVFSNTMIQKHQFLSAPFSSQSNSHIHTWPLEKP